MIGKSHLFLDLDRRDLERDRDRLCRRDLDRDLERDLLDLERRDLDLDLDLRDLFDLDLDRLLSLLLLLDRLRLLFSKEKCSQVNTKSIKPYSKTVLVPLLNISSPIQYHI